MTTRPVAPAPRCCRTRKDPVGETPRSALSVTSPAAAVAAANHGARTAMPLDVLPYGRNPIVFGTAADSPTITPRPFASTVIFPAAECTRLLCRVTLPYQTTLPVGCTRLASMRLIAKYADIVPLVSDYIHICFLPDLPLQLLLKLLLLLLLLRSAHGHAARLKIPLPLRTVRVPTIILPSRGFSCCCTSQLPQGYHPPPSLRAATRSLESSDVGGTEALPTAPSVGGD